MNSLYSLIEKNPEDISFYINDNNFFVASQNNPNLKNIEIPWGYKTVDYFDQQTSISLQNVVLSSGKIMKQANLPQHVNVNLIFKNDNETKNFIISYKKIQEGLFKISYKTLKNSEVIVKEIDGVKYEPFERVIINVPNDYSGTIINDISERKGTMELMEPAEENYVRLHGCE